MKVAVRPILLLTLLLLTISAMAAARRESQASSPAHSRTKPKRARKQVVSKVAASLINLPLSFEPNEGQAGPNTKFVSRGKGYSLSLHQDEAVLSLGKQSNVHSCRTTGQGAEPTHEQRRGRDGATVGIYCNGSSLVRTVTADATGFYYLAQTDALTAGTTYTARPTSIRTQTTGVFQPFPGTSQTFQWHGTVTALANVVMN